ncbi:hypothetical protein [Candidatus Harpocratesius sp.]
MNENGYNLFKALLTYLVIMNPNKLLQDKKKFLTVIIFVFVLYSTFIPNISAFTQISSIIIQQDDWKVKEGIELTYELNIQKSDLNSSFFNKIATEYQFENLSKNFFGVPQITVKVDEIPLNMSVRDLCSQILQLSGPIPVSQQIGDNWVQKSNVIIPFVIPVNYWDNLTDEIKLLPGVLEVEYSYSSDIGEYQYTIHQALMLDGKITHFYYYPTWQDDNGVLQAITIKLVNNYQYDQIKFVLSTKSNSFDFSSPSESVLNLISGILIFVIIAGIQIYVIKRKKEKKVHLDQEIKTEREQGIIYDRRDELEKLLQNISDFKNKHINRWIISNFISLGISIGAITIFENINPSANDKIPIILTILVGLTIVGILDFWLSIPLIQFGKGLFLQNFQNRGKKIDLSPIFVVFGTVAVFLSVSALQSFKTIVSLHEKLIIVFLSLFLVSILITFFYIFNPWHRYKKFEEEIKHLLINDL